MGLFVEDPFLVLGEPIDLAVESIEFIYLLE